MGLCGSSEAALQKEAEDKIKCLDKSILAKYLTLDQLKELAGFCTFLTVKEKGVVFNQGDNVDACYFVFEGAVDIEVSVEPNPQYNSKKPQTNDDEKGEMKITPHFNLSKQAKSGTKHLLCRKGEGEFFGLRALLNEPVMCSATASSKTTLLVLKLAEFDKYNVANNSALKQRILLCLGHNLEQALQGLAFLKDLEKDKLVLMASSFKWITLEKDAELFRRGELAKEGNGLHFLLEGQVRVLVLDEQEKQQEKVVAVVNKGQFFGEVGLVIQLPRTATVIARKKCLFLELTQANFRNFVQIAPEVLDAFKEKLQGYNIPLRYLIHNPILQKFFEDYLKEEKSAENLTFWVKAKNFRLSPNQDQDEARNEAQEIAEKFVGGQAESQVNIIGNTEKEILNALKSPSPINRDLLQKAEEEILALMDRDTFVRYKESATFQKCLSAMTSKDQFQQLAADHKTETKMVDVKAKKPAIDPDDPSNQF